jgi:hypothetical protein
VIAIERAGLALAALAGLREPTISPWPFRSTGYVKPTGKSDIVTLKNNRDAGFTGARQGWEGNPPEV